RNAYQRIADHRRCARPGHALRGRRAGHGDGSGEALMNPATLIHEPGRATLAADRALEGLGIRVLRASEGRATAVLTVMPEMANGHGIAHGGLVFALADTAFAMAANTFGAGIATAEASISYISPACIADELVAS